WLPCFTSLFSSYASSFHLYVLFHNLRTSRLSSHSTNSPPVPPPRVPPINPAPSSPDRSKITKAVLVAAAFFFFFHKCVITRRRRRDNKDGVENTLPPIPPPETVETTLSRESFTRLVGNVKGLILDENGLDVLYWRNLQSQRISGGFQKEILAGEDSGSQEKEVVTEIPLLGGRSSTSRSIIHNDSFEMPPPPILVKKSAPAPPPPPPPKKVPSPSPLPPPPTVKKAAALSSSALRPPPAPGGSSGSGQVKLKPLHWDKVNPKPTSLKQIFILDPRKSQNSAIVITSLGMTREKLVEALIKGQDFAAETLESLKSVTPTKEEQSAILGFDGDVAKLAEAESFLFHLLKAVPTAFARVNPFLFKANYYPEIAHHSKCLQTLDSACKELRSRGLFSVDGKTTLLNFVVEEVVRPEGKR
ncbi:unnamed protein product, partial [Brassica oleracea]